MSELPEVAEIQRYRHEPGDKVIVSVPARIDMANAERLRELVKLSLDVPISDVLIVADGVRIEIVSASPSAAE